MKAFLLILALSLPILSQASDWTLSDTARETTYQVLALADWRQTQDISNHQGYYEQNPILELHPSTAQINSYFAVTSLIHAGIAYMLPPKWRTPFEYVSIGVEVGAVTHNAHIGLHIKF